MISDYPTLPDQSADVWDYLALGIDITLLPTRRKDLAPGLSHFVKT
jgi:hypothetical protein